MKRLLRCLLAGWLLIAAWQAHADTVRLGDEPSYVLSRSFSYLEDPGGMLQLEDVLAPGTQAQFKKAKPPKKPSRAKAPKPDEASLRLTTGRSPALALAIVLLRQKRALPPVDGTRGAAHQWRTRRIPR